MMALVVINRNGSGAYISDFLHDAILSVALRNLMRRRCIPSGQVENSRAGQIKRLRRNPRREPEPHDGLESVSPDAFARRFDAIAGDDA